MGDLGDHDFAGRRYQMEEKPHRRILFIDAYDSFTCNITALLRNTLGVEVDVVHMDLKSFGTDQEPWSMQEFRERLRTYDAVVCGPGPGSPLNPKDVGVFRQVWDAADAETVPALGICLGFQSLVARFGGRIRKLKRGLHGMVREIEHTADGRDIFKGVQPFKATLYHSLCADIGQDHVPEELWQSGAKWEVTPDAPELLPLAWATEDREDGSERILMAVKHAQRPFWGVQYHPESVCTEPAAHAILVNWFDFVVAWNQSHRKGFDADRTPFPRYAELGHRSDDIYSQLLAVFMGRGMALKRNHYSYSQVQIPDGIDTADVAEILQQGGRETVILDSSSAGKRDPLATTSIIALDVDAAPKFEYRAKESQVHIRQGGSVHRIAAPSDARESRRFIWEALAAYQQLQYGSSTIDAPAACKFRGGFMGYLTYEMGYNALDAEEVPVRQPSSRPDLCLAWVQNSLVISHGTRTLYLQTLNTADEGPKWLEKTMHKIQNSPIWTRQSQHTAASSIANGLVAENVRVRVTKPDAEQYEEKVRRCQDAIAEGESYELCLTARTTMERPKCTSVPRYQRQAAGATMEEMMPSSPWDIYKTLRTRQPAPFGSFIRLGSASLLSSSPERFLSVNGQGLCEMRPMKGTVRKSKEVSTLAQAELLLHIPKEEAENLMIVDLVRHDLHSVCGHNGVTVPELLKVEEYESVFTMITVVNGQHPARDARELKACPFEILDAVFPPGSMTGAPKKRSCEILRSLEGSERMLYSGVVGYIDVMGQADWSVTIRSMFRYDDDAEGHEEGGASTEKWFIGAGGAVTILSTPEGEREEMMTKLAGPLGVFCDAA
ncbi:ADC synthase [Stachybotrys elegans]|uniref:aminodeoxychorismate synthase n=1 Tax=Stachybotrys elegans TaxID=80388 RepID=A0A8K0SR99_9HYPO|nr:ADC synthase [Stachybotrys elegans]